MIPEASARLASGGRLLAAWRLGLATDLGGVGVFGDREATRELSMLFNLTRKAILCLL